MTKFKRDEIEKEYQFYKLFKVKKKSSLKKWPNMKNQQVRGLFFNF